MSTKKQDIQRLLELKKLQEEQYALDKELDNKQIQEKMKLQLKYPEYIHLSAAVMGEKLAASPIEEEALVTAVSVHSEDPNPIIEDYKKLYRGKECYKEPETKNGKTELSFPSAEEAADFFNGQAEKNRSFIVVDKNNKVLAYSNGDGAMYHGDGTVFEKGGTFKPSANLPDLNDFSIPPKEEAGNSMSL